MEANKYQLKPLLPNQTGSTPISDAQFQAVPTYLMVCLAALRVPAQLGAPSTPMASHLVATILSHIRARPAAFTLRQAVEESEVCSRQVCFPSQGFTMHVRDATGLDVLRFKR